MNAELRDAAEDALAGWRYIRRIHGDLYGVGWDRVENALAEALAAQGIPTQRAETACPAPFIGSPVAESDAPNQEPQP